MHSELAEFDGAPSMAVEQQADVTVVTLDGELDILGAPALRSALLEELDGGRSCVVDLRGVGFVDSSVLGALLAARHRAAREGLRMILVVDPDQRPVTAAIAQAGLEFDHAATLAAALARATCGAHVPALTAVPVG